MAIPSDIELQVNEMLRRDDLDEAGYRAEYPKVITWINEKVSLVDLLREAGIDLQPISPDQPGAYVAKHGCPCCGENLYVKVT